MNQQGITDYQYFLASPFFAELADFDAPDTKIFIKSFCELSLPLRDFLSSPDVAAVIISLGEKYELQEKQISSLSRIIRDLVLGKIFIKDLTTNISSSLGIDETRSHQLVNELVSQSFGPIIEDIKQIQRTKFPDRVMTMREETKLPGPMPPAFKPPVSPQPINKPPAIGGDHPPEERQFKVLNLGPQGITSSQKSLEEELEKIANVIDLRNKNSS